MFISFEGIDGSGKSTQLSMLREWMEERGRRVISVREPGATTMSEAIREILLSNKQTITSTAELLLFSAARAQLVEKVIVPALQAGEVVLCDRYVDSTTAYQGYGRELDLQHVALCNQLAIQKVMPAITFFIDVPYEEAQQRMHFHPNGTEPDRMEKSGRAFFDRVRLGYQSIANHEPDRFIIVEGVQSREAIHKEVVDHVQRRLELLR